VKLVTLDEPGDAGVARLDYEEEEEEDEWDALVVKAEKVVAEDLLEIAVAVSKEEC